MTDIDIESLVKELESFAYSGFLQPSKQDLLKYASALSTAQSERDEQHAIVARIWELLGSPSYGELAGRSIYDLVAALQAERDEARKALEPFANAAQVKVTHWEGGRHIEQRPDGGQVFPASVITWGHVREAARVFQALSLTNKDKADG